MKIKPKETLIQATVISWLILWVATYMYVSRVSHVQMVILGADLPFTKLLARTSFSDYAGDLLTALAGAAIFSLACLTLGNALFRKQEASSPIHFATAFVIGEIAYSILFMILLNTQMLSPFSAGVSLIAGLLLGGRRTIMGLMEHFQNPNLHSTLQIWERRLAGLVFIVMGASLLYSSARLSYDSVVEYFIHAKIMAVTQSPTLLYPNDAFVVSSFHPGILTTTLIQLFGDQAARLFPWINGIAIIIASTAIGRKAGLSLRAQLYLTILITTSTAFIDLLGDGKIEITATMPILTAIYWMLHSIERPSRPVFILIGMLLGYAIISRPYNLFLIPVFTVVFYFQYLLIERNGAGADKKTLIGNAMWAFPPLLLMGLFHLLENWLFLGSPLAPLTYSGALDASEWQWQFDPKDLVYYRIFYPFAITILNSPQSLGNITPLVAASIPFLFSKRVREGLRFSTALTRTTITAITTLLLWIVLIFTVVEIRYVLFLWILLFIPFSLVIESIVEYGDGMPANALKIVLHILLIYMGIRAIFISFATYSPLDETGQANCYDLLSCAFLEEVNNSAPPGDRVMALNAHRYYLRPDLFICSSRADEYLPLQELARKNSPEFWVEAYRRGFRYITFEQNFAEFHSHFGPIPPAEIAPEWLRVSSVTFVEEKLITYQIEAVNPPFPPEISCRMDTNGVWQIVQKPD